MRRPLIAGNWKMNHTRAAALAFAQAFREGIGDAGKRADVALFPPFPYLAPLAEALKGSGIAVGAQDLHWENPGAFTGAVAAGMILDCGASMVLVGHSERRQFFGETDETVNRKVKKALEAKLVPVMCIGEVLAEREGGKTEAVLLRQLEGGFSGIADPGPLVLAYEPVWAIGTGKTATPAQAQEAHALIRKWLQQRCPKAAGSLRVLYGGSVKPNNIAELMKGPDVDGALVGGASLEAPSFLGILKNAVAAR